MSQREPRVVAVTGGAGFVGLNLVSALAAAGHSVVALHHSPLDTEAQRVRRRYADRIAFRDCDVRDETELGTLLSEYGVDDVVHAAAMTSPAHESALAMLDVNLRATQALLDLAATLPLQRFVFVSSAGVFRSAESATPLDEDFPITMEHPYAIFKVAAERLVAFARRERQIDATAVRLGFVYGPYERPTGSRTAMSSVHEAVALARQGEAIVAMAPHVGRDWIHAGDVARGVVQLLAHDGPLGDLYHLGTGRNYTIRETMETVAELVPGTVVRWTDDASKANVVVAESNRRAALGFGRAQADFGFSPGQSLRDGIREYLAFLAATERESA
jgi:nucleoside-diphosphate-sugar epimerase